MTFIAGRYTATWNALACGQTADGLRLNWSFFKQLITGDAWAQTPQDAVYQGMEMSLAMRLIEYDSAAVATIANPYASVHTIGLVGRCDVASTLAKQIVMTDVDGTTAATKPATITIPLTAIKEGFPIELLYAPALREVPIQLRCYPNQSTGVFATET